MQEQGSWQNLWMSGERTPRQGRFAGRTCDPMEGTHAGAVLEELWPMGRTHFREIRGEQTCTAAGQEVKKISSEVETRKKGGGRKVF